MLNEINDVIYNFFKGQMAVKFSNAFPLDEEKFSEKIFWRKTRDEQPQKPFIVLDVAMQGKINKNHETYRRKTDKKFVKRENWRKVITFGVYTQGTEGDFAEADRNAVDYIEYIEDLFNSEETFMALYKNGIIIKEKEISDIRDLSSFEETNYSYRYEIDVTIEFDKITVPEDYGIGQEVELDIEIKDNTDLRIQDRIKKGE